MPATFDPKEMRFNDFLSWATGNVTLSLGEGKPLRDAMLDVLDVALQNKTMRSIDTEVLVRQKEAVDNLANAIRNLQIYARDTCECWDKDKDSKVGKRLKALAGELPGYNAGVDVAHKLMSEHLPS